MFDLSFLLPSLTFLVPSFFPTCQVRLLDFMSDARLLLLLLPPSSFLRLAGPHLPVLDRSGPRRTSSASSRSQWASPDLFCQLLIAVGFAGLQPSPSAVGFAGLQPVRVWALWAESERCGPRRTSTGESPSAVVSPDFNRRESERCGPRRTSTGGSLSAVGLAGLQPARFGAPWAWPDFNRTSSARNKAI